MPTAQFQTKPGDLETRRVSSSSRLGIGTCCFRLVQWRPIDVSATGFCRPYARAPRVRVVCCVLKWQAKPNMYGTDGQAREDGRKLHLSFWSRKQTAHENDNVFCWFQMQWVWCNRWIGRVWPPVATHNASRGVLVGSYRTYNHFVSQHCAR